MARRTIRQIRGLAARIQSLPLGAFVALTLAVPAFAGTTSGTAMPWETPLQTIQESITGPVAKAVGIIAITIAGVPRMIAVLNGTITAILALGLQVPLIGIPLGLAIHAGCYWLNKRDPYFFDALKRHIRQRPYLDA